MLKTIKVSWALSGALYRFLLQIRIFNKYTKKNIIDIEIMLAQLYLNGSGKND